MNDAATIAKPPAANPGEAWVSMTSLDEPEGQEERSGPASPDAWNFGGLNGLDRRGQSHACSGRGPELPVAGGGAAQSRIRPIGLDYNPAALEA